MINCTEIGAKQLFNDNNLFSIKGHLLMVKFSLFHLFVILSIFNNFLLKQAEAPWLKHGVTYTDHPEGCTYFLPL